MGGRAAYLGPEVRRPMVLDAAQDIFAEGGFAAASMAAIAARAGVSKAVLYDCFPGGKTEIYAAMIDRARTVLERFVFDLVDHTNRLPLEEALRRGFHGFAGYALAHPAQFQILFGEPGTADPTIVEIRGRVQDEFVERMNVRTEQILGAVGLRLTPARTLYNKIIVATAEEIARTLLADRTCSPERLIERAVAFLMGGFSSVTPGEAWKHPAP